ncbi:hypothetical protein GWI33_001335 [Rhynchophorus ferrugineus]|uniref:Uncharacterized protein n=1 Tax=Rhynchophorus ferrugineus TaxID=354439 RepID=A0A834ILB2_RHYFE|nr:hypothetical protein GWI33_001335 [Rhynchophorus ferrugineus]
MTCIGYQEKICKKRVAFDSPWRLSEVFKACSKPIRSDLARNMGSNRLAHVDRTRWFFLVLAGTAAPNVSRRINHNPPYRSAIKRLMFCVELQF